jgi:pimeloyl-ACP methyl ester carboxylesterase
MRLHHVRNGGGPPLLLIHGLGASHVTWRPVLELLARKRDVIAIDLPGFGRSPPLPPGTPPTTANLAAGVIEFCEAVGASRPHVAGNSLGGWVALEMAKRAAAASVCAISPAGLWREPLGQRRVSPYAVGRAIRPLVNALLRTSRGRAWLLRDIAARPELIPPQDARVWVLGYLDSPGYPAASFEMRAGAFEHEGRIDVPVTIAWGDVDRTVGRPSRTRRPPGARYLEMPGWGHTPTWDDPEGVARLILEASGG